MDSNNLCRFNSDETSLEYYQCATNRDIKKGEHICFNYGASHSRFWIINYGFVIPDNEYDGFGVHVQLGDESDNKKVVALFKGKS